MHLGVHLTRGYSWCVTHGIFPTDWTATTETSACLLDVAASAVGLNCVCQLRSQRLMCFMRDVRDAAIDMLICLDAGGRKRATEILLVIYGENRSC